MVKQHYRWDFIGLSTDNKPTADNVKVTEGSTFYESDTSKYYIWHKDRWYEKVVEGGGGGGDSPSPISAKTDKAQGDGVIDAYDTETGIITGTGFGSSKGIVWFLDRDTHTYIPLETSNWTSTAITLKEPIDATSFEGHTSIVVETSDGIWTTKLMVYGSEIEATLGYVYYQDETTGEIVKLEVDDWSHVLQQSGNVLYNYQITISNHTFYSDDIVGIMIKSRGEFSGKTASLSDLFNLNQPLFIPASFFANNAQTCCYSLLSFNQPFIEDPEASVGGSNNFFSSNYNFNQPLTLKSHGTGAYRYLFNFNQTATVIGLNTNSLERSMVKKVVFNFPTTPPNASNYLQNLASPCVIDVGEFEPPSSQYAQSWLTADSDISETYIKGITIKGANRQAWLTAMPDSSTSPYRKLIDGGE